MDDLQLLLDFHVNNQRQGPGSDAITKLALALTGIDQTQPLAVADIGCGTGASALLLGEHLQAEITAVDFLQPFLSELESRAQQKGVADKIKTACCSMDDLPFAEQTLDLIWSEGAIYNIGFEEGIKQWRRFLKPGGVIAVSEITWLTDDRPQELNDYWNTAYPQIDTAAGNISKLEQNGYSPLGYFVLPDYCWQENYYQPLEAGCADFLERHNNSDQAKAIVDENRQETELYQKYKDYYSYGFYIAEKTM